MQKNKEIKKNTKEEDFVSKNFLLISLEEKKIKKIADVINNDTCRKIIDSLSKKESTESELAKELNAPLSTIHYNIKQLQEAGLVVVEEFHYSKKGKEVNHYKLANKYILITPVNTDSKIIDAIKKIIPLAIITAVVATIFQIVDILFKNLYRNNAKNMIYNTYSFAEKTSTIETIYSNLQIQPTTYFIIGGIIVIIIYFLYELLKNKKTKIK